MQALRKENTGEEMPYRFHDDAMVLGRSYTTSSALGLWFYVCCSDHITTSTAVVRSKGRSCVTEVVTLGRKVLHDVKGILCSLVFLSSTHPSLVWGLKKTPASLGQFWGFVQVTAATAPNCFIAYSIFCTLCLCILLGIQCLLFE